MRPEDFRADDLFGQIQALVDCLAQEREAKEAAEAADQAKSELLATVSHELRTPMGAIISMAELLQQTALDETQKKYASTLHQSARSLLTVLNDILDFSKLDAGRFELDTAPFDLHDLVQSVAQGLQARASERGLASGLDIGATCPRFVKGDATRIRQILTNLVDNALKFTSEGSVRLHVSARETDSSFMLRFDVSDTGIGLDHEGQERLFEPYIQAGSTTATQYGGTGLGLSIAQRLVLLMGGEIGCESEVGQGSMFWFAIAAERAESSQKAKEAQPTRRLQGHLLVVEDNAVNRMLIGAYLDEFGLTYEMVETGASAIMALASNSYDLVLMDIMMPELDGVQTTQRCRLLHGPAAEVPIIALTAKAMKGDREKFLASGMNGYVSKPIRGRELHAALAPFLALDEDMAYHDVVPFLPRRKTRNRAS
ncbi:MAG TPA: ATP-binding protein [Methyloceanibacter sp.]|jgi:CheY-like chemotaxis protein/nitrogen-specific signal transduction histidine kinase